MKPETKNGEKPRKLPYGKLLVPKTKYGKCIESSIILGLQRNTRKNYRMEAFSMR